MRARYDERKLRILEFLDLHPSSTIDEIRSAMGVSRGSLASTLHRLSKQGLLARSWREQRRKDG